MDEELAQKIALFRYGIIAGLTHLPPGSKGLYDEIRQKAARNYTIPGSSRTRIAAETIRDWLKRHRKGGFDALIPKTRKDAGRSRALSQAVADLLIAAKEANPALSVSRLIHEVRQSGALAPELTLAPSTVHKLLDKAGLMKKDSPPESKDHRRFSFEHAGQLFMADVMHGPAVWTKNRQKRKTYLIALIDDATRVIAHAAFAFGEDAANFMAVFKQAILRRGIPVRLFVDNGAAFRSHHLELVCAKLNVHLIHARAYHAQAKGKIERWFRTARLQFLPQLGQEQLQSIDALNRALWTYVEADYHRSIHRILGCTPLDRWAECGQKVRFIEPGVDLDDLFLMETKRKVYRDRIVSLHGLVYEVDAALVGETVTVRHDPSRPGQPVQIWFDGKRIEEARLVDTHANCFVKRSKPTQTLAPMDTTPEDQPLQPPPAPRHPVSYATLNATKEVS
ncbi:MAG: DDE-type integrase/transposase/recombinase [Thermodesulfobacteriota bacterium]